MRPFEEYTKDFVTNKLGTEISGFINAKKLYGGTISQIYKIKLNTESLIYKAITKDVEADIFFHNECKRITKNGTRQKWRMPNIVHNKNFDDIEGGRYLQEFIEGERSDQIFNTKDISEKKLHEYHFLLGEILSKIHKSTFAGFGRPKVVENKIHGEHESYQAYFEAKFCDKKIMPAASLLRSSYEDVYKSKEIITNYANQVLGVLCHNDLYMHNTFGDENITVIDPNVVIDIKPMDLAMTLTHNLGQGYHDFTVDILKGYKEIIPKDVLLSALLIRGLRSLSNNIGKRTSDYIQSKQVNFLKGYDKLKNIL